MWMGSICHLVFELLLLPRHKKHYNLIISNSEVEASKPIQRLVIKHLKKYGIFEEDNLKDVNKMVLVGLKEDFFVKGGKLLEPEFQFDIENEKPKYRIFGFIDKIAQFKKENKIEIIDYKSSKAKFKGESLDANTQAMMYSLVAKKTWPKLKPTVKFMFLRFPKSPIQELNFSEEALSGFEYYLEEVFKKLENFKEKDAQADFAADKPKPSDGGWGGNLCCGFATFEGQKKVNGNLMWHCPYKFAVTYFVLKDKDGGVLKTSDSNNFSPKKGETVEEMKYKGCPKFV